MKNKKIIIVIVCLLVVLVIGSGYYFLRGEKGINLEKLKQQNPDLATWVDDVAKWDKQLKDDESRIESYNTLGMTWKQLADQACFKQVENCKQYYGEALKVYQKGIDVSKRTNTLLMTNAGNMAKNMDDYVLAEDYYKEAISVSPGDSSYYILLAELYEYRMNKTKEEVVAVYDQGIARVITPGFLTKRKADYLSRVEQ